MLLNVAASLLLASFASQPIQAHDAPKAQTYRVRQTTTVSEIPEGARKLRWWIAIPDDDRAQDVLDIQVASAPGAWRIERELEHGNRFLYVEVDQPKAGSLDTVVEFTLRRSALRVKVDLAKVGTLTAEQRKLFVEELRLDAPHMQATDEIRAIADKTCGDEQNIATQAGKLLDYVAGFADHYSKDPSKPKCGIGDARDCITNAGGCCTDLHSLFIALARSRGIPARLQMGYRLLSKNVGNEVDPGYRCWPEYFVPGYGWVPADIVEADAANGDERAMWLSGLSERRLWLNEGREFRLNPKQDGAPVNTMIMGYAEIDGQPARVLPDGDKLPQLTRKVRFVEVPEGESAALHAPKL